VRSSTEPKGSDSVADSGASAILTDDRRVFKGIVRRCSMPITGISGANALRATGVGRGRLYIGTTQVEVPLVYYVPGMGRTLLSISALAQVGLSTSFTSVSSPSTTPSRMIIRNDATGKELISVPCVHGLYSLKAPTATGAATAIFQCDLQPSPGTQLRGLLAATSGKFMANTYVGDTPLDSLIHNRIGHLSYGNRQLTSRLRAVYGQALGKNHKNCACAACMRAKMVQTFNRAPASRPTNTPLGRLHWDFVPVPKVASIGNFVGFVLIVDEGTSMVWAFPVKLKSDVSPILKDFVIRSERQFASKTGTFTCPYELAALRSDGGGENISAEFAAWCRGRGVTHELSAPYCQWQNGIAERFVRTVWSGAEAMRKHAGMPARYWPFAIQAFTYTWSRMAMGDDDRSPVEQWNLTTVPLGQRVAHLRTFGCRCYVHVAKALRGRLDDKARLAVFIGYSDRSKAYLAIDIQSGKVLTAVSVAFDETSFPFKTLAIAGLEDPQANDYEQLMERVTQSESPYAIPPSVAGSTTPRPLTPHPRPSSRLPGSLVENLPTAVAQPARRTELPPPDSLSPALPVPATPAPVQRTLVSSYGRPPPHNLFPPELTPMDSEPAAASIDNLADDIGATRNDEEAWSVGSILGHKIYEVRDANNVSIEGCKEDRYRIRWTGYAEDSWEPASSFDIDQDHGKFTEYKLKHAAAIARNRARFPLQIRGYDYVEPVAPAPPPAPSSPSSPWRPPQPAEHPSPTQAPPRQASSPSPAPPPPRPSMPTRSSTAQLRRSTRHGDDVPSLRALLASAFEATDSVPPVHDNDFRVDINGASYPRPTSENAQCRHRIASVLANDNVSPLNLGRIRQRINLLALAAKLPARSKCTPQLQLKAPQSFRQALASVNCPAWLRSMDDEMDAMRDFGVWVLEPLPPGAREISTKWVFRVKRNPDGSVSKLKSRLTARGFTMREGVDYDETWAPTARMRCFRLMMAEASGDSSIKTAGWDLTSAFLHATMDKTVYMKQPPGHVDPLNPLLSCRLIKAIYGTPQASRLFYLTIKSALLKLGFNPSLADECLFIKRQGTSFMKLLVHVDDFAITYNDRALYDEVFAAMQAQFKMTDFGGGALMRFLGIEIEHDDTDCSIRLHQGPYLAELFTRLRITGSAQSPEAAGSKQRLRPVDLPLSADDARLLDDFDYKGAVAALFYVARATRPDIAHAVSQVARFMDRPGPKHMAAVLRIYNFLHRTHDVALNMAASDMSLSVHDCEAFSDADWAGCTETTKSTTGWIVRVGGSTVAWYSKRQGSVAQSSCEAEYVAAAAAANEVVWWRRLLSDFGHGGTGPTKLYCDNRAATILARHSGRFEATKHIGLRLHVLRRYQEHGHIDVTWLPASEMLADIMTKNSEPKLFRRLASIIMGEAV
jgi:hypothetical protein